MKERKKILITPEYAMADLAESHRMSSIAKAFLDLGHEVYILGRGKYDYLFKDPRYHIEKIDFDNKWMNYEKFIEIHDLDVCGLNFVTEQELEKFIKEEVKLLNKIKPDVVINGFRPTMSISTKLLKIPYVWVLSATISDLYDENNLRTLPHGFGKKVKIIRFLIRLFSKKFFMFILKKYIIMPKWYGVWNNIMEKNSLTKYDLMMGVFRGDFNIMSDAKELFPEFEDVPDYYGFSGPLLPEIHIKTPDSLKKYKKKKDRPVIFFSMGSSGDPELFKEIIKSFEGKPYDVFAAYTSIIDKKQIDYIPDNVIIEKMFPAIELTKLADVAVIHGGQGTVYTTIFGGAPFVGIPMFSEQQWNLENAARNGCGIVIPRLNLDVADVQNAIQKILNDKEYKNNMMKLKNKIEKYETDKKLYPPMVAAKKIIDFLDNKKESYFDVKGY